RPRPPRHVKPPRHLRTTTPGTNHHTMTDAATEPPVLFDERGRLGLITLNRPRAINALTIDMVRLIAAKLDEWEHADAVHTVAITGAGERGLCAGGDITLLHGVARDGSLAD